MDEELKDIVKRMVEAGESEDNIRLVIENYKPSTKDNGVGVLGHIGGQFWKGVASTTGSTLRGIGNMAYRTAAPVVEAISGEPVPSIEEASRTRTPGVIGPSDIYALGNAIEHGIDDTGITKTNPKFEEKGGVTGMALNDVPQGLGSTVPFMLTAGATAPEAALLQQQGRLLTGRQVLGKLGKEGVNMLTSSTGVSGGAAALDQTFQEALKAGKSDPEAFAIAMKNYVGGATEALPLEHIFMRLNNATGKGLTKYLKQSVAGGLEEGFQEMLQQYWGNQVAKGNYDPERDPMTGVLKSGGSAFVIGMILPFAANAPGIASETKEKIINAFAPSKKAVPEIEKQYDTTVPDANLNKAIDDEFAPVANEINKIIEDYKLDLSEDISDEHTNTTASTEKPAEVTNTEPATGNITAGNVENPAAPEVVEYPKSIYRTSKNEMTDAAKYGAPERGGIMHAWTDPKTNNSIGLFTVKPSLTGAVEADSRLDALEPKGVSQEAHPAFTGKDFGNITTEIGVKRPLNLLPTVDTGMEMHTDEIIKAAQQSNAVNQDAFILFLDKVEGMPDDKKQAAVAAFLRTKAGGEFDGIAYENNAEIVKPAKPKKKRAPKPVAIKEAPQEDNVTYIEKANNIVKKNENRPGSVVPALEKLLKKAEGKKLEEASSHINKAIEKHNEIQAAKEVEAEEKAAIKEKKAAKQEKPNKEVKKIEHEGKSKSLQGWKDYYYKQIGAAEGHNQQVRIDKYNEFRKEIGKQPVSPERIQQILKSDIVQKGGKSVKENEAKAAKKEAVSKKEAAEQAKKDIAKMMGIDPNEITDLTFIGTPMSEVAEGKLKQEGLDGFPREVISAEEYRALAPKSQHSILEALFNIVQKYKAKEGTGIKFIKVTVPKEAKFPGIAGFQFGLTKTDNSYIVVLVDEATGRPILDESGRNTVLHEYIHEYTKMMFHRLYASNKDFAKEVGKSFDYIKNSVFNQTEDLVLKLIQKEELTDEETDLLVMISTVLPFNKEENRSKVMEDITTSHRDFISGGSLKTAQIAAKFITERIYRDFYAFTNPHEMMAEVFSDPQTVFFLSNIKVGEITSGINKGQPKTALYKWYEDLVKWVKGKFAYTEVGEVANNALQHFMDVIGSFDQEFVNGNLQRQQNTGMFFGYDADEVMSLEDTVDETLFDRVANKAKKTYRKIINTLTYTMEGKQGIKTLQDVKDYLNGVNSHLPKGKKINVDNYAPKIFNKIKRIRKQREIAKQHQTKLINNARQLPQYKNDWKFKDDVDDFAAVNIDDLKIKLGNNEVMEYINGLGMMSINGIPSNRAYNIMINHAKKNAILKSLLPVANKLNQKFVDGLAYWSNPATLSSVIGKYDTEKSNKILSGIYGGIMRSSARMVEEASAFQHELSDIIDKNNMTHSDLATVGIYGGIFSTVSKPGTHEWDKEVLTNAKHAYDSSLNKLKASEEGNYTNLAKSYIKNEVDIAKNIFEKIQAKGSIKLTDSQQKIYDNIREFAVKHEDNFERNSVGGWNNSDFQKRYNYFPTLALGSVDKEGDFKRDTLVDDKEDNMFDAISTANKGDYGGVYSKKVWSNYKRFNPRGYFYEYDALSIANKWSKKMLYDMYATKELKAINRVLEDSEFKKQFNLKTRNAFKSQLRSITGANNKMNPEMSWLFKKALKFRDAIYTSSLVTGTQILTQSVSGFAAAGVLSAHLNPVTSGKIFAKAVKAAFSATFNKDGKYQKFLSHEALGVASRNVLREKFLSADDYHDYKVARGLKRLGNKAENISEWSIRSGDNLGAKIVWFASYFNSGGTIEKPNKAAIVEAERVTGILQGMSDANFSPQAFKYDSSWQKIVMGMFYAYKMFSVNAAQNIFYSTGRINTPEGRKVLSAQIGSIMAYHSMQALLTGGVAATIMRAFAGGDDEDKKRVGYLEEVLTQSVWDMLIGGWAPSFVDGFFRWIYNSEVAPSLHKHGYEDFDRFKDSPLYSVKEPSELYKEVFGPGMKEPVNMLFDGAVLMHEQLAADMYLDDLDKAEKRADDLNAYTFRTIGTIYGGITGLPLRGDVKRMMDAWSKKIKADSRNNKAYNVKESSQEPLFIPELNP